MSKRVTRKRMLVLLLTLTMILSCLNLSGYGRTSGVTNAQELTTATDSEVSVAEAGENEGEEFQYENTYSSENFDVNFKLDNVWDAGYNATVTIINTSDSVIDNWCLTFPLNETISNIWNASVSKEHEDFYVIKNAGWNQDIAVGGSVSFGITVYEPFTEFPEYYTIIGNQVETKSEDYTIEYKITEDWGEGYKAEVTITNNKDTAIEDWRLSFEYGDNLITQIWNAEIVDNTDGKYELSCPSYNQNIASGGSVTFGFMVEPGCSGKLMENVVLREYVNIVDEFGTNDSESDIISIQINTDELQFDDGLQMYYVEEPINSLNGTLSTINNVDSITYCISSKSGYIVNCGELEPSQEWTIKDICLIYGGNNISISVKTYNGEIYVEKISIYNSSFENLNNGNMAEEEIDKCLQEILVSDIDGDGLCDYYEREVLYTDCLISDSDGDGIFDGEEDFDLDGLNNLYEVLLGADPFFDDSDLDDLNDGDEVNKYFTDPLLYDTDSDGASDYFEIDVGYDPLIYNEKFDCSVFYSSKIDNFGTIKVELDNATGMAVDTFLIDEILDDPLLGQTVPGYLGSMVELTTEGEFEKAKISYELSEELFNKTHFRPALYYFNEEKQCMERVEEQVLEGNVIKAELYHFSKYVVLNEFLYGGIEENYIKYIEPEEIESAGTDYFIIIHNDEDSVYYCDMDKREYVKGHFESEKLMSEKLIGKLKPKDRVSFLVYDNEYIMSPLSNEKEELNTTLGNIEMEQDISLYDSLGIAFDYIKSDEYKNDYNKNSKSCVIVLTLGYDYNVMKDYLKVLNENNTVFLGVSISWDDDNLDLKGYYTSMLEPYGKGIYNYCTCKDSKYNANVVLSLIENYYDKYFDFKDSDSDGICDYYEGYIKTGELTTAFGRKFSAINLNSYDSDGDGLLDGDEIKVISIGGKPYIFMITDPTMADTDGDGILDNEDSSPLCKGYYSEELHDIIVGRLMIVSIV